MIHFPAVDSTSSPSTLLLSSALVSAGWSVAVRSKAALLGIPHAADRPAPHGVVNRLPQCGQSSPVYSSR
jgi:hypothetical protein